MSDKENARNNKRENENEKKDRSNGSSFTHEFFKFFKWRYEPLERISWREVCVECTSPISSFYPFIEVFGEPSIVHDHNGSERKVSFLEIGTKNHTDLELN